MSSVPEMLHVVSHRPICFWTALDVEDWLKRRRPKLALLYGPCLARAGVSGRVLVEITEEELKQCGVENAEDRMELLLEIRKEKLHSDLDELGKLNNQS